MIASVLGAFLTSTAMTAISRLNYPGGKALNRLHKIGPELNITGVRRVHMDTLTCMTGVTRFEQQKAPPILGADDLAWVYDKTENKSILSEESFWNTVDFALAETPETVLGEWEILDTIDGFAGFAVEKPGSEHRSNHGVGIHDGKAVDMDKLASGGSQWREIFLSVHHAFETTMKRHVTRGWWFKVRMEPRFCIMRRLDKLHTDDEDTLFEKEAENVLDEALEQEIHNLQT